jgi:hypothetical protein
MNMPFVCPVIAQSIAAPSLIANNSGLILFVTRTTKFVSSTDHEPPHYVVFSTPL